MLPISSVPCILSIHQMISPNYPRLQLEVPSTKIILDFHQRCSVANCCQCLWCDVFWFNLCHQLCPPMTDEQDYVLFEWKISHKTPFSFKYPKVVNVSYQNEHPWPKSLWGIPWPLMCWWREQCVQVFQRGAQTQISIHFKTAHCI